VKIKQKVLGQFRSPDGAFRFAVLRSITDTVLKNKQDMLSSLNFMKNRIILLILGLFLLEACIKPDENCDRISGGSYELIMPFTLTPAQGIYHVGDTITISSTVNNPVYERKTGNSYILDDFKFFLKSYLYYMDTLINDYSNFNRFEVLLDSSCDQNIFTYSDGHNSILGQYTYQNNQYSYEFKLVAKEKGSYLFSQGSGIWSRGEDQYFEGKCTNTNVDARFYMNDRADNNSHLLNEALNPNFKLYTKNLGPQYLDFGGYCFKVVD